MYAENLAKMSMPAVLASGCLGASLGYLETKWRNLKLTSTRLPIANACLSMCACIPGWSQFLLQEFFYLVDINLDFTIKGHKRRVGSWSKVVEVSRLPDNPKVRRMWSLSCVS